MVRDTICICGCITQAKGHSSKSKNTKETSESRLLMIFRVHGDLIVAGIAIKEAINGLTGESFKHLIHKGQWEVILPCSLIESSIINAHPPSGDGP
ncbi:hypothetical protein MTR_6g472380 [Medicago truncatula]|uniref:Uncharacterized protein n=1 Tax=Medicago truncatula TaxID=3880 RepID=A0A072ULM7_MEDTR|nr:hypothetical protein MTR_6g472380 [Medicago truncatula]